MASNPNDGKLLYGQDYIKEDGVVAPFTQVTIQAANKATYLGVDATEIDPVQESSLKVKTYDKATIQATYTSTSNWLQLATTVSFTLPPILSSFTVAVDSAFGDGNTTVIAEGAAVGTSVSVSLSPRVEGTGSGTIMPDIQPVVSTPWTNDLPALELLGFMVADFSPTQVLSALSLKLIASGTISGTTVTMTIATPGVVTWNGHGMANGDTFLLKTIGALPTGLVVDTVYYLVNKATNTFQLSLTKGGSAINTTGSQSGTHTGYKAVRPWPLFFPQPHVITSSGQTASIQTSASVQQQVSISPGPDVSLVYSEGTGISRQVSTNVKTTFIPPTLHGALVLNFPTNPGDYTQKVTITSQAAITLNSGTNWPARSADTTSITFDIEAHLSPNLFPATTPAAYPTSGYYLQNIDTGSYSYDLSRVRAIIFNFATLVP